MSKFEKFMCHPATVPAIVYTLLLVCLFLGLLYTLDDYGENYGLRSVVGITLFPATVLIAWIADEVRGR